jgi:hypothetical protein
LAFFAELFWLRGSLHLCFPGGRAFSVFPFCGVLPMYYHRTVAMAASFSTDRRAKQGNRRSAMLTDDQRASQEHAIPAGLVPDSLSMGAGGSTLALFSAQSGVLALLNAQWRLKAVVAQMVGFPPGFQPLGAMPLTDAGDAWQIYGTGAGEVFQVTLEQPVNAAGPAWVLYR